MAEFNPSPEKPSLDKDLDKYTFIEASTHFVLKSIAAPGLGVIFLVMSSLLATLFVSGNQGAAIIVAAAAIAAYMALNIGANDVTNNVGAAVGSRAISMAGALVLAAVFEIAGAMLGGGDVVATFKTGIIRPSEIGDPGLMITIMMSALLSAAIWINVATWLNAPVSTTHSIVGGVLGGAVMVLGMAALKWDLILSIFAAWILSPLIGGLIAAGFLWLISETIIYRDDKIGAAKVWVPVLLTVMTGAFTAYLALKGISHIITLNLMQCLALGMALATPGYFWFRRRVAQQAINLENRNQSLKILFRIPLIMAAAILSFAHGANDVANAIGPLAAIVEASGIRSFATNLDAPFWVTLIGALGISAGLLLFGPRLIRVVGGQITKLNPLRAFCVSISAAITVIVASVFGIPVSSTHVVVGAVFGVGFFREWYETHSTRRKNYIERRAIQALPPVSPKVKGPIDAYEEGEGEASRYRYLVRRSHFMSIMAAWIVTVPAAGLLSALITAILLSLSF